MKILVVGAKGQLGSEIRKLVLEYPNFHFTFSDLPELDICDYELLFKYVKENNIDAIINCAAYTAVDKAETETSLAEKVNVTGVNNLVKIIKEVNGKIIHISTDYVFDGNACIPYKEEDKTNPLGVYGMTKYEGERKVLNSEVNGIVIRTSWLYSSFGNNFVKTMLRLGSEKKELGVIFDQVGTPTYAADLAKACLEILSKKEKLNDKGKLYHFSNEGVASWYDFSKAIMEIAKIECKIEPIETKDYPTAAKRPQYSILNKTKIKSYFGLSIPYWRDSLEKCIQVIENK